MRRQKRAETEKSRKREAERKYEKEKHREKKDRVGTREARKKERKEEIEKEKEKERKGNSKTEGRRRCARGRGKERPEQDSERRQRPFFDKLVTRRYPAAKGAEGSSLAQGGKRRGRRSSWPKGEGRGVVGRSEENGTGEEGWVRGGCRVLRRSITA